jgi:hypothetical protein
MLNYTPNTGNIQKKMTCLPFCVICRDDIVCPGSIANSICGHVFHLDCIYRWIVTYPNNTCPVCRQVNPFIRQTTPSTPPTTPQTTPPTTPPTTPQQTRRAQVVPDAPRANRYRPRARILFARP